MSATAKEDPYTVIQAIFRQLQRQVNEEDVLQKLIIIMQQNSAHFEEGIVRSIQSAWQTFDEWSSRMYSQVQETWVGLGATMRSLQPNPESFAFAARSDHLLDPDTPLHNPETIDYPSKDDPSAIPVHQGILRAQEELHQTYKESFYVPPPPLLVTSTSTAHSTLIVNPPRSSPSSCPSALSACPQLWPRRDTSSTSRAA
ncbi:unnamed protein product [Tilletia controversa]|nr:unnamed protein product [Tilletia controversa]